MSIEDLGRMKECEHEEYLRIYDKHKDTLRVFSSYSGGILGMPEMSTAWGIKGHETALIASECANWEHRREDPEAWTYWKNADLVAALDRESDLLAALEALSPAFGFEEKIDRDEGFVVRGNNPVLMAAFKMANDAIKKSRRNKEATA